MMKARYIRWHSLSLLLLVYSHSLFSQNQETQTLITSVTPLNTPLLRKDKNKKARLRKSSRTQKRNTTLSHMNMQELQDALTVARKAGSTEYAIKCVERMMVLCTDMEQQPLLLLTLAELHFESGNFETSGTLYANFIQRYPGHPQLELASFRAILSSFNLTLDPDRDQSNTLQTIALIEQFLEHQDIFTQFNKRVAEIQTECYRKLIESELNICSFYLRQGNVTAVQQRMRDIRDRLLTQVPQLEEAIVALEEQLPADIRLALRSTTSHPAPSSTTTPILLTQNEDKRMKNRF